MTRRASLSPTPVARIERIVIVGHDAQPARRLAWRFAETGLVVESYGFSQARSKLTELNHGDLMIIDLGWGESELTQSMDFLFRATSLPTRPKILALVPRLTGNSRPDWAELGVTTALDRTTPPPDVARIALKIAQFSTFSSD